MSAAESTGRAARALPLFYSLSQAGKAIVAARGGVPSVRHGLGLPELAEGTILDSTIKVYESGWFRAVSDCTGSPMPSQSPQLGALVASLPDVASPGSTVLSWPRALRVFVDESPFSMMGRRGVRILFDPPPDDMGQAGHIIAHYPTADGRVALFSSAHFPADFVSGLLRDPNGASVTWDLTDPPGSPPTVDNVSGIDEYLVADEAGGQWLRPHIVPVRGERPPTPLMTWWLVLFGLSMLARYHPREWVEALDVDRSDVAVLLDHCMATAMRVVPALVLEAIQSM